MSMPLGAGQKSLPLILARELAANLATPMFLIDAMGTIVFYNDAAAHLIGKPFAEVGEIDVAEWSEKLELCDLDGSRLRRRDTPPGVAFFERRAAHRMVRARSFDGVARTVEITAYPLFGHTDDMHGVVIIFWEGHNGSREVE